MKFLCMLIPSKACYSHESNRINIQKLYLSPQQFTVQLVALVKHLPKALKSKILKQDYTVEEVLEKLY